MITNNKLSFRNLVFMQRNSQKNILVWNLKFKMLSFEKLKIITIKMFHFFKSYCFAIR